VGFGFHFQRQREGAQIEGRLGATEDAENFLTAGYGMGRLVQKYFCGFIIDGENSCTALTSRIDMVIGSSVPEVALFA
jgi:hypothetical protein